MNLGCPDKDQIASIAEIKATRDIFEHNSGIVNQVYLNKAKGKARFGLGESIEISDQYLFDSWKLLSGICAKMTYNAAKLL